LKREFSRLKSEAQSIIRFKEITMLPSEALWELDQRLKCTIPIPQMVRSIINVAFKERAVTTEANNSGIGLGDHDDAT